MAVQAATTGKGRVNFCKASAIGDAATTANFCGATGATVWTKSAVVKQRKRLNGATLHNPLGEFANRCTLYRLERHHRSHPWLFALGQTNPKISRAGRGYGFLKITAERCSAYPANQLTHRPAKTHHVITVARAGRPKGFFCGELVGHEVPIAAGIIRKFLANAGHADRVIEHHPYRGLLFAVACKLGPVFLYRRIQFQIAAVDEGVCCERNRTFGAGVNHRYSVFVPGIISLAVFSAAPKINNALAFERDRNRSAQLVAA